MENEAEEAIEMLFWMFAKRRNAHSNDENKEVTKEYEERAPGEKVGKFVHFGLPLKMIGSHDRERADVGTAQA